MTIYAQNEPISYRRKFTFVCVDDTDGKSPETGLTFSAGEVGLRKSWQTSYTAVANIATIVEIGDGEYQGEFTAAELDSVGPLLLKVKKTGVRTAILAIGQVASDLFGEIRRGTAQGGSATTITLDTGASAANNFYVGKIISIVDGLGAGQSRIITGYVGASKVATVRDSWSGLGTDSTSVFVIREGDNGRLMDNEITSAKIAGLAITSAAIAAGAIHATAIASNAITSAKIAANAIGASQIAANAIGASQIAANAIGASQIAANAITSSQLDATAVSEIQAGLATSASLATAQTDLDNIQTRLPAALVGGRMDSSVGAMAADTVTASALAADAVTEIQSGLATQSDAFDIAGLLHRNAMIDNVVHDGNGFMTSARLRVFSDAAALAAASAGAADNADGEISRYTLTGTATSNLLSSFKVGKTL